MWGSVRCQCWKYYWCWIISGWAVESYTSLLNWSMNIKVFVVLLLFAACCRLEADPSEGLKDLLHKIAVKNSGMEYKATWLTFSLFWLPLYKDIFSDSKVPHPVHNITAIRSGSELKDVRNGGWSVATPATAFLLGSAVYIFTLCFLCLWSPDDHFSLAGFLKWFLMWHLLPFFHSINVWTAYGFANPRNPVQKLVA